MVRFAVAPGTAGRLAVGVAAAFVGLGGLAVAQGSGPVTTYAGQSTVAAVLGSVAGFALVLAGLVVSFGRSSKLVGALTVAAGVAWFAPMWVGWHGGPAVVRSVGMLAAGFVVPLVLHAVLAYPDGRVRMLAGRAVILAAYAGALLVALALALFRDPFFDPDCWANCTDNAFLVRSLPGLARAIEMTDRWLTAAVAAAFVTVCSARLASGSGSARRAVVPVAVPGMVFAGAVTARAVALQRSSREDPADPVFLTIFVVASAALILLAGGLVWGFVRTRLQRRAVAAIVSSLGEAPPPGSLESGLAKALGDPQLRIAYWLPGAQRFVDGSGRAVPEPGGAPGRATTALVRDDRRVALVSHATGLPGIEAQVGPAVRLALENERLQAQGLAHLEELRASRARIVETGDAERRRLERDLHDGAQQRLLAVSYEIRLAGAKAEADGDVETGPLLADALDGVQAALEELRELAHGIYPAILGEAGLGPAVATLADTAPLEVEIGEVTGERYPPAVETAAYMLVAEALDDAATRDATHATVSAVRDHDQLVISVEDDGSERTSGMTNLEDRVGALGGSLAIRSTVVSAAIPCE